MESERIWEIKGELTQIKSREAGAAGCRTLLMRRLFKNQRDGDDDDGDDEPAAFLSQLSGPTGSNNYATS